MSTILTRQQVLEEIAKHLDSDPVHLANMLVKNPAFQLVLNFDYADIQITYTTLKVVCCDGRNYSFADFKSRVAEGSL